MDLSQIQRQPNRFGAAIGQGVGAGIQSGISAYQQQQAQQQSQQQEQEAIAAQKEKTKNYLASTGLDDNFSNFIADADPETQKTMFQNLPDILRWQKDNSPDMGAQATPEIRAEMMSKAIMPVGTRLKQEELGMRREERLEAADIKKQEKLETHKLKEQQRIDKNLKPFNDTLDKAAINAEKMLSEYYKMKDLRLTGKVSSGLTGRLPNILQSKESEDYDTASNALAGYLASQQGIPTEYKIKQAGTTKPSLINKPEVQESLENHGIEQAQAILLKSDLRNAVADANGGRQPENIKSMVSKKFDAAKRELPSSFEYEEGDKAVLDNGDEYIIVDRRWKPEKVSL